MIRLAVLFPVLLVIVLLGGRTWAASDLLGFAYDQRLGDRVPPTAVFNDEQGRAVTLRHALDQHPTILALGYFRCPNLCGLVRNDLMNALSRLDAPHDYSLVVISIDPSETPADARSARAVDIAHFDHPEDTGTRHYLTGPSPDIRTVTDAVGFRSCFDTRGSLTQRYVKRHRIRQNISEISPLDKFRNPHLAVLFSGRFCKAGVQPN